jgi:carboxypeptidase C (cathepsin A)
MKKIISFCANAFLSVGIASAATPGGDPAQRFVADHQATIAGHLVRYRSTVEEFFAHDADGKRTASIYTISYVRNDVPHGAQRPILFVFNGGPGSASLWLNMGFVGPKRVELGDPPAMQTVPPFRTVDNAESPLDVADVVLIDPPGTGFSRIAPDGKPEQFYGAKADAKVTATVIEDWLRLHGRWNAPKYLVAESYGTVRAALVARYLAGGPTETGGMNGITLDGVILLGQIMRMTMPHNDDLQYVNSLPTLAATACYFGRVSTPCDPKARAEAARQFASTDYLDALYQGARLSAEKRTAIARELAGLTGLSPNAIDAQDLRVSNGQFAKLLLADKGQQLGMYDGRYTLPLKASGNDPVADDPAMGQYAPAFVATLNQYLHDDLGVRLDVPYKVISFLDVNARWDYGSGPGVLPNTDYSLDLAVAMRRNGAMRLFVGAGLYDFVTTMGDAQYTVDHSGIPLDRTTLAYYASGHMPYLGDDPRRALSADIRAFLTRPAKSPSR